RAGERAHLAGEEPGVSPPDADHLEPLPQRVADGSADGGVHPGRIAAARQDADSAHRPMIARSGAAPDSPPAGRRGGAPPRLPVLAPRAPTPAEASPRSCTRARELRRAGWRAAPGPRHRWRPPAAGSLLAALAPPFVPALSPYQ